jgi:PAS domain S-box-containing protein
MISILYVDDEPSLLDLGKTFLECAGGFSVDTCTSVAEARERLRNRDYDLILSDYQMPETDGLVFLKQLRASDDQTPFIIFTGRGREEVVIDALNSGADFYLQKGGDPKSQFAELTNKIRYAVKRRTTEKSLHQSELFLQETQKIARLGGWKSNPHTDYLEWTEGIYSIIEAPHDYHPNLTEGMKYYSPEDVPVIREKIAACLLTGDPFEMEVRIITETGKTVWTELRGLAPVIEGKRSYVMGTLQDITERKKAEEELQASYEQIAASEEELRGQYEELVISEQDIRESEEKFRTIMDSSIDGIMLIDVTGTILAWNPASEQIFGIPSNEALGSNIVDLQIRLIVQEHRNPAYIQELRNRFATSFPALFSKTSPLFLEVEVMNARGQRMIVQQTLFPIQTSRGKRIGCISREVTQQRSAEKSLRESENKFRTLFENSGDAIMFIDREVVLDCNTRTEVIFGKTRAQIIGMSPGGLSPEFQPDGQSSAENALEKMAAAFLGEPQFFDWVHVRTDGSLFDAEVTLNRVEVGGKYYLQAVVRDITDRKKMETALRESEEQYRSVVNNQSDMIARFTPDGIIRFVNESYRAYFTSSLDISEIVGKSIRDLMQIKNYPEVEAFLGLLTPENPVREAERQFTGSDGESYWQTWSVRAILGPDMKVTEYQAVGRDITERKRAEEALASEKQFSDAVMDSIPGTFFVLDDRGNFVRINKNQEKLIGYTAEEMVGTSGFATIAEVDRDRIVARMHEILETGYGTDTALVITRDGRTFPMLLTAVSALIGGKRYIIGTGIDISELKTAEKGLQESEERFRALSDAALEGIMIHERGVIVDCNPRFAEMFGYTPEEIIGRNGFEFMLTPESCDTIFRWGKNGFQGSIDITAIRKDGTQFSGETTAAMISWKGKPHNIVHMRDITDRKRVEEMLRQNEEQFRSIVGLIVDGIHIHEIEPDGSPGKFIEVNEVACRMLQYPREELLQHGPLDFVTGYHSRPLPDILRELSLTGHAIFETEHRRKDGTVFPVEINNRIVQLQGKQVVVSVVRDITDRKEAEEVIHRSEEKYRLLIENSHDIIYTITPTGSFTFVSPGWTRLLGHPVNEVVGRSFREFVHPDDIARCQGFIQRAFQTGEKQTGAEYRVRHADGSWRWHITNAVPIYDDAGRIIGGEGSASDITERKQAEMTLRESEDRFRTILHSMQHGILIIDAETHVILDANDKAREMIGRDKDHIIGSVCHRFICPAESGKCPVTDLGLKVDSSERILLNGEGKAIPIIKTVIRTTLGGMDVLIESFIDITQRKQAEEALHRANHKLTLLSSITRHDINNQLTALMGYLLLMEDNPADTTFEDYFLRASASARRISSIIAFTREYEKIGVNAPVWQECRSLAGTAVKEAPLGAVKVNNDFPDGMKVFADPLIVKVLYNLMDNAVRYGGKITTIRFFAEEREGNTILICEDDGDGIPESEKERIFERGIGKNTGLGLALSREILAITGITLHETGELGKGARFEMVVPEGIWHLESTSEGL